MSKEEKRHKPPRPIAIVLNNLLALELISEILANDELSAPAKEILVIKLVESLRSPKPPTPPAPGPGPVPTPFPPYGPFPPTPTRATRAPAQAELLKELFEKLFGNS